MRRNVSNPALSWPSYCHVLFGQGGFRFSQRVSSGDRAFLIFPRFFPGLFYLLDILIGDVIRLNGGEWSSHVHLGLIYVTRTDGDLPEFLETLNQTPVKLVRFTGEPVWSDTWKAFTWTRRVTDVKNRSPSVRGRLEAPLQGGSPDRTFLEGPGIRHSIYRETMKIRVVVTSSTLRDSWRYPPPQRARMRKSIDPHTQHGGELHCRFQVVRSVECHSSNAGVANPCNFETHNIGFTPFIFLTMCFVCSASLCPSTFLSYLFEAYFMSAGFTDSQDIATNPSVTSWSAFSPRDYFGSLFVVSFWMQSKYINLRTFRRLAQQSDNPNVVSSACPKLPHRASVGAGSWDSSVLPLLDTCETLLQHWDASALHSSLQANLLQ